MGVQMLPDQGTLPIANIVLVSWYVYAVCVPKVLREHGL